MTHHPQTRPVILVGAEKYLPGWKAGGPIRSLANMVEQLGDEFDFRVVTEDRDRADTRPYPGIAFDTWLPVGKAKVLYTRKSALALGGFARRVDALKPDLVYLNSLLWTVTVEYLFRRRLKSRDAPPLLISPRGELDPGALSIRPLRKKVYLGIGRALGWFREVTWQASTDVEARYIADHIPRARVDVAANVVEGPPAEPRPHTPKTPGSARFVFVSRVGPKKNLPYLLETLRSVHGDIALEIHGRKVPSEWHVVEHLLADGLDHVAVSYHGDTSHSKVDPALEKAHFFALPTLAESFGHAIYEALRLGRPVIISDRTPWRNLEQHDAGWDLSLADRSAWIDTLQRCVDMDDDEYRRWSAGANRMAREWFARSDRAADQASVFRRAMGSER